VRRTETCLAGGIVVLGLLLLAGVRVIAPGVGYDRIGPRFFPIVTAAGLILLGIALATSAWRRRPQVEAAVESTAVTSPLNWVPFGYFALAFLLFIALLDAAGFVFAATLQFWLVARAFRSRRPARDAMIAVVLSLIVYLAFSRGLGLPLPAGILEGWL
jgi:putative tricarboxylic transport membrane protein